MTSILYVEDEVALASVIGLRLRAEGMLVDVATTAQQALAMCEEKTYDLTLIDVHLGAGMNGLELGAEVRRRGRAASVLMLTAAGDLDTKLSAFEMGAEDYLTKPFEFAELLARIRVLTSRAAASGQPSARTPLRPIRLLRDTLKLRIYDDEVELTSTEFKLLRVLEDANGSFVTAEQLCAELWGQARLHHRKSLYVHVNKVRAKLGQHQSVLENVKRLGYRMVWPDEGESAPVEAKS
ncbi:MAG TPA: response regulator transcription factor [Polyangiaceae bacterium]|nr:response regulator transcription factor [Polyangiaceae bacterium]